MSLIDFHAHILPNADHGSKSSQESLSQLKLAKDCGVTRIVATPHFYPERDDVKAFLDRRAGAYRRLASKMPQGYPDIRLGAEVLICDNLEDLPGIDELCVYGSNIMLLELPFNDFSDNYAVTVKCLIKMGIDVVLAHADRYDPSNIEKMISAGAKIQLNAISLCSLFKEKHLYNWMNRGLVVALGSDIHGVDSKAYSRFVKAQKKAKDYIHYIEEASDNMWAKFKAYK